MTSFIQNQNITFGDYARCITSTSKVMITFFAFTGIGFFFCHTRAGGGDMGHAPLLNTVAIIFLIKLKSCRRLLRPFFDLKYCTNLVWVFDFLDCFPCAISYTASISLYFSQLSTSLCTNITIITIHSCKITPLKGKQYKWFYERRHESLNNKQYLVTWTLATDTWTLSKQSSKGSHVKKSCRQGSITEMLSSHI